MTQDEIALLQFELALRGVIMIVPQSVYHMDMDKALSVCLDMYEGLSFRQAIDAYDKGII